MEDLIDSVRRILGRWTQTVSPIVAPVKPGDKILEVATARRFRRNDEVMIEDPAEGEPNLIIERVLDDTHILLSNSVFNDWPLSRNPVLRKLTNGMYIEGIYYGDPPIIPLYPAITVSGTSTGSEWLTLDSTKETYNLEIGIHVEASTFEDGERFMHRLGELVRLGLKNNFYPLVNDFDVVQITHDISRGDNYIKVSDSSVFETDISDKIVTDPRTGEKYRRTGARCIVEDRWKSEELRAVKILDDTTIEVVPRICHDYKVSDNAIAIQPKRHFFNTWPEQVSYGQSSRDGTLLQTATVSWFAWEEDVFKFKNNEPHLR